MDSPGEILNLCRLCLVKDQVNIPIFEEQGDIRQIFLKISSCLPVTITRHDQLPKRICDACSNKLDLLYEFWNSSASAEKTLLSWLGQAGVEDAGEKISAVAQQIAKPAETLVKEESEALDESNLINESRDSFEDQSIDDEGTKDEAEAPPPKRARRTAAVKAQINITPESDEDEDDDFDAGEAMTKMEDESEESESDMKDDPSYSELPGTSADDQAGPSGVGKDGVEAPCQINSGPELLVDIKEEIIIDEPHLLEVVKFEEETNDQSIHEKDLQNTALFQCNVCNRTLANLRNLNAHMLIHSGKRPFQCDICHTGFTQKQGLQIHMNKHTKETQYKCELCPKVFLTADGLRSHSLTHSNALPFECDICNLKFKRKKRLTAHRNKHTMEKRYDCKVCGKIFFSSNNLRCHLVTHSEDRPFQCDICKASFKKKFDLKLHQNKHSKEKQYSCKICHKSYLYLNSLITHMSSHSDKRPFECNVCNSKFKLKRHLSRHVNIHKKTN